jgi:hypothetical protein
MGGQQMGGQQMGGQQAGGQQMVGQQPRGARFEDKLNDQMRLALDDFYEAAKVTEWCADQCIDLGPEMADCIRLCRDVADLATLNIKFMSRDSAYGADLAETFAIVAEDCATECAQHSHDHCQECASVLSRAVDSTYKMLDSFAGESQQGQPQAGPSMSGRR